MSMHISYVNATLKQQAIRISQQAMTTDDNLQVIKAAQSVELEAENQGVETLSMLQSCHAWHALLSQGPVATWQSWQM